MPNYTGEKTLMLHYMSPNITSFSPDSVNTLGQQVTVKGDNFGDDVDKVLVLYGNVELPIRRNTFNHTHFVVDVPSGEGPARDVTITVDGQVGRVSRFDKNRILKYNFPVIDSVTPDLVGTRGGNVTVRGEYYGRVGVAEAFLTDVEDGDEESADRLPINLVVGPTSSHNYLHLHLSPGQGRTNLNVNVSGLVSRSPLNFIPPSINGNDGVAVLVNTDGGENITLEGANFGVGSDYKIEMVDMDLDEESESEDLLPSANNNNNILFNAMSGIMKFNETSNLIKQFDHERVVFKSPAGERAKRASLVTEEWEATNTLLIHSCSHALGTGQNAYDRNLALKITVAGQSSNTIPFNFKAPAIHKLVMCFPSNTAFVFEGACVDQSMVALGDNCDPFSAAGCGLSTSGGYTISVMGENFGKADANIQSLLFNNKIISTAGEILQAKFISHNEVRFRVPPGVGSDIDVLVKVGERKTEGFKFSYDPPFVEHISPPRPNAEGDIITINGKNFGPSLVGAGNIEIYVGQFIYDDLYGISNHTEVSERSEAKRSEPKKQLLQSLIYPLCSG